MTITSNLKKCNVTQCLLLIYTGVCHLRESIEMNFKLPHSTSHLNYTFICNDLSSFSSIIFKRGKRNNESISNYNFVFYILYTKEVGCSTNYNYTLKHYTNF